MVERYAHVAPEALQSAASRLDAAFDGYDLATGGRAGIEKWLGNVMNPTHLRCRGRFVPLPVPHAWHFWSSGQPQSTSV
jgi:hypothetical protein